MKRGRGGIWALAALLVVAAALIGVELGKGAIDYGSKTVADSCAPREPFPGSGVDATLQRVVLDGLDGAACKLGVTREDLVLSFAPEKTGVRLLWDRATVEKAVRAGLLRSLDEAERRGDVGGLVASVARTAIEHAPIDWLIEGGSKLTDLFNLG